MAFTDDPFDTMTPAAGADAELAVRQHLPPWPLIACVGSMVISVALLLLPAYDLPLAVVGYVLTPLAAVGCVAWAQSLDATLCLNVWYDRNPMALLRIRVLGLLSFGIGFAHMWTIANYFGHLFAGGIQ